MQESDPITLLFRYNVLTRLSSHFQCKQALVSQSEFLWKGEGSVPCSQRRGENVDLPRQEMIPRRIPKNNPVLPSCKMGRPHSIFRFLPLGGITSNGDEDSQDRNDGTLEFGQPYGVSDNITG